jgi:two-component sensor histidine kinase
MMGVHPSILPPDEDQRMAAVRRYDILDTPPDGMFDRITALAARRFDVPISIISVVDEDRIWFKSHHGVDAAQIDRAPGLCASAILSADPHILKDASLDPRSLANPLVAGEFGLRFYAGVPLRTTDGFNLGTLCIIDKEARPISQTQIDDLKDLASVVMDQLELRLSARQALARSEIMAREIDHRVMNSLQFVAGLLAMQSRSSGLEDASRQLEIAAQRVQAVARVHRHFYLEDTGENVSCVTYLERLCADLSGILERPIIVVGDQGVIPTTLIQPIGLLVNELVTNAAKHGDGEIHVSYRVKGGRRILTVCDLGPGLPDKFDVATARTGLGMRVISALAKQLKGELSASANQAGKGACFAVSFRAD